MRNFLRIAHSLNMVPIAQELMYNPDLWAAVPFRQEYEGSPHKDIQDIILRYAKPAVTQATLDTYDHSKVQNDTTPVWYPAAEKLVAWKPLVADLMRSVGAYSLERALFARLPEGGVVLKHADIAGNYVHLGDIGRYHIVVQGEPGVLFYGDDECVQMKTGEVWLFNAHCMHEIINNSSADRIHLIVDLRIW